MIIKDKYGSKINLQQAKNGKIIIPFADHILTLSKEDAEKFCLYDIEDFNQEEFLNAYRDKHQELIYRGLLIR